MTSSSPLANATASRPDWIIAIFLVLIQQGAFVSTPLVIADASQFALQDSPNLYNTIGISSSILLLCLACRPWLRHIGALAMNNGASLLFMLLVLLSTTWSIHPDLTIKRGVGYVVTLCVALFLSVRFNIVDRLKVLSASFATAAIASVVFIATFPSYGIMQGEDLGGNWRGVFSHKNVFGPVMAVAVFTELYVLVASEGRPRWRFFSLSAYFALVVLSRSDTALLLSLAYLAGTCLFLLWQRDKALCLGVSMLVGLFVLVVAISVWSDPAFVLGILGKDPTLTGRTTLWSLVMPVIGQRPVLGWGYRAMWQPNDVSAALIETDWGASSSHNTFLEITLQLGLVGAAAMLVIIAIALRRGVRCSAAPGRMQLGWFSLMFFVGTILAAQTMETLGQNQVIEWVVFNVLLFACGPSLTSRPYAVDVDEHDQRRGFIKQPRLPRQSLT